MVNYSWKLESGLFMRQKWMDRKFCTGAGRVQVEMQSQTNRSNRRCASSSRSPRWKRRFPFCYPFSAGWTFSFPCSHSSRRFREKPEKRSEKFSPELCTENGQLASFYLGCIGSSHTQKDALVVLLWQNSRGQIDRHGIDRGEKKQNALFCFNIKHLSIVVVDCRFKRF